jgi:hypothetical protein
MYLQQGVGATFDHNMFDTTCIGSDCVLGDPQFVNPASHDFHLKGISTAIDRGSSIGAPSVDFDGNARPQGAGYDIGAYEQNATSPTTTYLLTVVNGSGSGSYALGTNMTITANTPPSGKVFDKWTGDISYVSDINRSTSTELSQVRLSLLLLPMKILMSKRSGKDEDKFKVLSVADISN